MRKRNVLSNKRETTVQLKDSRAVASSHVFAKKQIVFISNYWTFKIKRYRGEKKKHRNSVFCLSLKT